MTVSQRSQSVQSSHLLLSRNNFLILCATDVMSIIIHLRKGTLLRLQQQRLHLSYPLRYFFATKKSGMLVMITCRALTGKLWQNMKIVHYQLLLETIFRRNEDAETNQPMQSDRPNKKCLFDHLEYPATRNVCERVLFSNTIRGSLCGMLTISNNF